MERTILITTESLALLILNNVDTPLFRGTILEDAFDIADILQRDYSSITRYMLNCSNWDFIEGLQNESDSYSVTFNPVTVSFTITYDSTLPLSPRALFRHMYDFSNWVFRSECREEYPWEANALDIGICHTEEDGDYNGGYIYVVIALLEAFLVVHYGSSTNDTYYL